MHRVAKCLLMLGHKTEFWASHDALSGLLSIITLAAMGWYALTRDEKVCNSMRIEMLSTLWVASVQMCDLVHVRPTKSFHDYSGNRCVISKILAYLALYRFKETPSSRFATRLQHLGSTLS